MNDTIAKALAELANIVKIVFTDKSEVIAELHKETKESVVIANPVKYLEGGSLLSYYNKNQSHAILDKGYIFAMTHPDSAVREHYVRHVVGKSLES